MEKELKQIVRTEFCKHYLANHYTKSEINPYTNVFDSDPETWKSGIFNTEVAEGVSDDFIQVQHIPTGMSFITNFHSSFLLVKQLKAAIKDFYQKRDTTNSRRLSEDERIGMGLVIANEVIAKVEGEKAFYDGLNKESDSE